MAHLPRHSGLTAQHRTILAIVLLLSSQHAVIAAEAGLLPHSAPDRFDVALCLRHVEALVALGERVAGSRAEREAAAYLAKELAALGYDVETQPVPLPGGADSVNVVGRAPGLDPERHAFIIVGGHIDSVGSAGPIDNASGAAIALELARAARYDPAVPLVVVGFGAEERSVDGSALHGSTVFVESLGPAQRHHLRAMLNLDALGTTSGLREVGGLAPPVEPRPSDLAHGLGIELLTGPFPLPSDSHSFSASGLPAVWLTSVTPGTGVHTSRDSLDRIDPRALLQAGRLALATIRAWAEP